jgi:hypothetical protein
MSKKGFLLGVVLGGAATARSPFSKNSKPKS